MDTDALRHWGRTHISTGALLFLLLAAGCQLVVFTGVVAVGAVAAAGYTVVKTGEVAVRAVTGGGKRTEKKTDSVTVSQNQFSTHVKDSVGALYKAADQVVGKLGFQPMSSSGDAMTANVRAKMASGQTLYLRFTLASKDLTRVQIEISPDGSLKQVEYIYDEILAAIATEAQTGTVQ